MPRRTAHAENPASQALRAKRGGEWIASDLLGSDDPSEHLYSDDGLYIGSSSVESAVEDGPLSRFIVASLLVGVLFRLIGLIQYSGFTKAAGKSWFEKRMTTVRTVAKAGSKLALGYPLNTVMYIAMIENGKTNLAFEIVSALLSVYDSTPSEDEDGDPVAIVIAFIASHKHLPSCVSEDVRNTDADVATSDLSAEYELVIPTIFETTERPPDPRFDAALQSVIMVQRLVSCQWFHDCHTELMEIGHFPYYKKKGSTEMDYDLFEMSAIKLVLQEFTRANFIGLGVCSRCQKRATWFTPIRFPMSTLQAENTPDPQSSVSSLARSCFTAKELTCQITPENFISAHKRDEVAAKAIGAFRWQPPWHPVHTECDKTDTPWILDKIGDTTISRRKEPRHGRNLDPPVVKAFGAYTNTQM